MSSVDSTGTRVWYEPASARFAEHGTKGPGAVRVRRAHVLSDADAARYTASAVLSRLDPDGGDKRARRSAMRIQFVALALAAIVGAIAEPTVDVYLVGDSTMADKPTPETNPERGWGQLLPRLLRRARRDPQPCGERTQHEGVHRRGQVGRRRARAQAGRLRLHPVRPQRREGRRLRAVRRSVHRVSQEPRALRGRDARQGRHADSVHADRASKVQRAGHARGHARRVSARRARGRPRPQRRVRRPPDADRGPRSRRGAGGLEEALRLGRARRIEHVSRRAIRTTRTSPCSARRASPDSPRRPSREARCRSASSSATSDARRAKTRRFRCGRAAHPERWAHRPTTSRRSRRSSRRRPSATGAAVLVFPGGGYEHLAWDKEGTSVARWLNTLGVSAFVVRYRLGPAIPPSDDAHRRSPRRARRPCPRERLGHRSLEDRRHRLLGRRTHGLDRRHAMDRGRPRRAPTPSSARRRAPIWRFSCIRSSR